MDNIIEIKNLKKYFGKVKAVDDISFNVKKGSLFAFLGINGAGKSTTINILCSILEKDSGEIFVNGLNIDKDRDLIKRKIGIVFQNSMLDEKLNVYDNLTIRASYYGLRGAEWKSRLNLLVKLLNLEDLLKRPFNKLSGGQKRRVDIARGLINNPEILFLDEPTTGLDPQTRQIVWKIINILREDLDMTVFLTTHYMEEANKADNVVIIDNGKIVANDSPNNLKNRYSGDYIKLYTNRSPQLDKHIKESGYDYYYIGEGYNIKVNGSKSALNFITNNLGILSDFEVIKGDMDDVFLNVCGKKLNDGGLL